MYGIYEQNALAQKTTVTSFVLAQALTSTNARVKKKESVISHDKVCTI